MIRLKLALHVLMVAIAASYLTLGWANPNRASELWAVYAAMTLALASVTLWLERKP